MVQRVCSVGQCGDFSYTLREAMLKVGLQNLTTYSYLKMYEINLLLNYVKQIKYDIKTEKKLITLKQ